MDLIDVNVVYVTFEYYLQFFLKTVLSSAQQIQVVEIRRKVTHVVVTSINLGPM